MTLNQPTEKSRIVVCDWHQFDSLVAQADFPIPVFKQTIAKTTEYLTAQFNAGYPVAELVSLRAAFIDQILARVWSRFFDPGDDSIALIAVGGYGRGELHPASDIDLLLLLAHNNHQDFAQNIEHFLLFLWDIGLEVGHSVRTTTECVEQGELDITIATNLMEARRLIGPETLFQEMLKCTGPDRIWPSSEFFQAKLQEQQKRHRRFGDTAYNLEPNIKENPGGLRDIQVIGWVVKRHFGATTLKDLVSHDFLTEQEYQTLITSQDFLWRIRFGLHVLAGRRDDRLQFDHQRKLAEQFGYQDSEHRMAVELFMKDYYRIVMELNRLNEMLLQLFDEAILHGGERTQILSINNRFQSCNGYIEVKHDKVFKRYPFALLEIFLILEQHRELRGVRAETIRLIRESRYLIDQEFRNDVRCQSLFMEIFRQPEGLTHELRRMNRYGVLAYYIPAFGQIVGQMQHDMFHVYTVDEHTLFLVRNLRRFTVEEFSHELPICSNIISKIPKTELLYLAGLFHDIAKGRGGDHSQLGAREATDFCQLHALSVYDTKLVAWLVSNHLIMSMTAQKQDIADPDTITDFANYVGSQDRLDYIFLLTVADIRATSPTLWNSWKESLLTELYYSTTRALRRGLDNPELQQDRIADCQQAVTLALLDLGYDKKQIQDTWLCLEQDYFLRFSNDEIIWQTDTILKADKGQFPLVSLRQIPKYGRTELFIYSDRHQHTFALVTDAIERLSLTITDARVVSSNTGCTLETFILLERDGSNIKDPLRLQEIKEKLIFVLSQPNDPPAVIKHSDVSVSRQVKQFDIPPEITFLTDPIHQRTVVELIARDQPGLLAKVARVLQKNNLQIQNAKIATFGARAEDIFFIVDEQGSPVSSEETLHRLQQELVSSLQT